MSDKMFWWVVGGILVLEIGAFFFLVFPKMRQYGAKAEELKDQVAAMERLKKKKVDELATEYLEKRRKQYADSLKENCEAAVAFWKDRDEEFEAFPPGVDDNVSSWIVYYNDAFNKLESDYREHANADENKDFQSPFKKIPDQDAQDPEKVRENQKRWRMTEMLSRAVMEYESSEILEIKRMPEDRELAKVFPLEDFDRIRMVLRARLPAKRVPQLVSRILNDRAINYSIDRIEVGKLVSGLQWEVVKEIPDGQPLEPEPPVEIWLEVDALDWKRQTEEEAA